MAVSMDKAFYIIILFVLAGGLMILELFIPSQGILSILAAASLIYGIVRCFLVSPLLGLIVTIVTLVTLPVFIIALVRIWPDTWIGKRVAIRRAQRAMPGGSIPDVEKLDKLLGATGKAITDLRPVGAVMFGQDRVDCVAETGQIENGSEVTVIRVEGVRVVVREQS